MRHGVPRSGEEGAHERMTSEKNYGAGFQAFKSPNMDAYRSIHTCGKHMRACRTHMRDMRGAHPGCVAHLGKLHARV